MRGHVANLRPRLQHRLSPRLHGLTILRPLRGHVANLRPRLPPPTRLDTSKASARPRRKPKTSARTKPEAFARPCRTLTLTLTLLTLSLTLTPPPPPFCAAAADGSWPRRPRRPSRRRAPSARVAQDLDALDRAFADRYLPCTMNVHPVLVRYCRVISSSSRVCLPTCPRPSPPNNASANEQRVHAHSRRRSTHGDRCST